MSRQEVAMTERKNADGSIRHVPETAAIDRTAYIGSGVALGAHVKIERDAVLEDGCVIGDEVVVGEGLTVPSGVAVRMLGSTAVMVQVPRPIPSYWDVYPVD